MAFNIMGLTELAKTCIPFELRKSDFPFGKCNRMPSEVTFPKLETCENVKSTAEMWVYVIQKDKHSVLSK